MLGTSLRQNEIRRARMTHPAAATSSPSAAHRRQLGRSLGPPEGARSVTEGCVRILRQSMRHLGIGQMPHRDIWPPGSFCDRRRRVHQNSLLNPIPNLPIAADQTSATVDISYRKLCGTFLPRLSLTEIAHTKLPATRRVKVATGLFDLRSAGRNTLPAMPTLPLSLNSMHKAADRGLMASATT